MKERFVILFFVFYLSACSSLVGIKKVRAMTDMDIKSAATQNGIGTERIYKIDTAKIKRFYAFLKQENPTAYKDVFQPLQLRVFDSKGYNTMLLVNCYVGGIPLKWNRFNTFDSFPLRQSFFTKPVVGQKLEETLEFILPITGTEIKAGSLKENDETIFVFWTSFMGKHAEDLIQIVNNYRNKNSLKKIEVYWINIDNLYIS